MGIGQVWRRAIAKCVFGECGNDGLEAGIEGGIHAVTMRATEHETMDVSVIEVNNDIWMWTHDEGQSQDITPARILWE